MSINSLSRLLFSAVVCAVAFALPAFAEDGRNANKPTEALLVSETAQQGPKTAKHENRYLEYRRQYHHLYYRQ